MNPWIQHVKKVAEEKGISYTQALKVASATYKGAPSKTMKGEEDFTTKRTSKVYHRKGKDVKEPMRP